MSQRRGDRNEKGSRCQSNYDTDREDKHRLDHLLLTPRSQDDPVGRAARRVLLIDRGNRYCDRQVDGVSLGKAMAHVMALPAERGCAGLPLSHTTVTLEGT
jgi:hypothetical protein